MISEAPRDLVGLAELDLAKPAWRMHPPPAGPRALGPKVLLPFVPGGNGHGSAQAGNSGFL